LAALEATIRPIKGLSGLFGIQPVEVIIEGHDMFRDRRDEILKERFKKSPILLKKF